MNIADHIRRYKLEQRSWMYHRNEINIEKISDTLAALKACCGSADISENILYYSMTQFAHIDHIKYILSVIGDLTPEAKNNIQDIIQWMYICCEYNVGGVHVGHPLIYNHYIWLLDQYAKCCGVTYRKGYRIEKLI